MMMMMMIIMMMIIIIIINLKKEEARMTAGILISKTRSKHKTWKVQSKAVYYIIQNASPVNFR